MSVEIIATLGPSSINPGTISQLISSGCKDLRINLSHSNKESLRSYVDVCRQANCIPSLDTQGAQLRVIDLSSQHYTKNDEIVIAFKSKLAGKDFSSLGTNFLVINHAEALEQFAEGDYLRIDFSGLLIQITSINTNQNFATGRVIEAGTCQLNRALDVVDKHINLEHLTEFDRYAIDQIPGIGSTRVYYSFAEESANINSLRELLPNTVSIISKIESIKGLQNMESIIEASDGILIDRGDISRQISISLVPLVTNSVINACLKKRTPVYVATNVLDSMMKSPLPSRAEISDIWNLLEKGVDGIVLAAEVAIGDNPVQSIATVKHMCTLMEYQSNNLSFLSQHKMLSKDVGLGGQLSTWL